MVTETYLSPQPLPGWLLSIFPKRQATGGVKDSAHGVDDVIPERQRNSRLTSMGGAMRRQGMTQEEIEVALLAVNTSRCRPPLPEEEVRKIAWSVGRYAPAPDVASVSTNGQGPKEAVGTPWPEPMAQEAFYGLAGDIVKTIEPHTEADRSALLINFLVYFGNEVGNSPHAIAEADRHGTNFDVVLVGRTAKARKGSSRGYIHEFFKQAAPTWTDTRIWGGMSSGEGLIWAVRDPIEKTDPVKEKGRHTGAYETTIIDQGVTDKRLLVYEPEFASVLRVMSRDSNTLSTQIRQAWDSGTLRTMTKNNPAVATGAHISILGHITKEELLRYLTDIEAGNGFANRILWMCTRRAQVLPEGGGTPDYSRLVQPLHDSLEQARLIGRIERDTEAKKAWATIYEELSGEKPGLFGSVTARAEAQVLRLSVLYAAMDGADAIKLSHLKAALAVWEYAEASARYIFGDATGDPVADRILESLRQGELTRTAISYLFQKNVSAARLQQGLNLLVSARRARFERRDTDGTKPTEVWMAIG